MKPGLVLAVIAALLLFSIAVNLHLRKDPFLPNHADEWDLLTYVREMQAQQKTVFYDPTTSGPLPEGPQYYLEVNYHLFVLSLLNLSGIDVLLLPFAMSVLFSFLLALSTFVLVREFTKNSLAAFISGVFVFGLKNNVALLGYSFMAPMAFGMAMVPLIIYTFIKGLYSTRHFLIFSIITLNTFFSHPVYAVLIVPAALLFFLLRPKVLFKNFPKVIGIAGIILAAGLISVRHLLEGSFSQAVLGLFVFPQDIYIGSYPLLGFLHPEEFFLMACGIGFLLLFSFPFEGRIKNFAGRLSGWMKINFPMNFNFALFAFAFAVVWIFVRLYSDINKICLFGPCRRTATGFVIVLLLLAGIGLFFFFKLIVEKIFSAKGMAGTGLVIIAALALSGLLFQYVMYSGLQYKADMYNVVDKTQLPDLEWMKGLPYNSNIFSPELIPKAVALISEKKIPGVLRARLGNIKLPAEAFAISFNPFSSAKNPAQEIGYFLRQNCDRQKQIIKKYGITHAYWAEDRECLAADRIFDGGVWHVSEFNR